MQLHLAPADQKRLTLNHSIMEPGSLTMPPIASHENHVI